MFQRSIAFYESKRGLHHHDIPFDLIRISEALCQMGRGFVEHIHLLDRAVTILELSVGRAMDQDVSQLAAVLRDCASLYEEAGSSTRPRRGGPSV